MSRALNALLLMALLGACAQQQPPVMTPVVVPEPSSVERWLVMQMQIEDLESDAIVEQLVDMGLPQDGEQLYRYGLLNQQLDTYGAWVQARDSFKTLNEDNALSAEQRQLARLLLRYNQSRINWYTLYGKQQAENQELQEQLSETEGEKAELEEKIQALTDLEAVISTRKAE